MSRRCALLLLFLPVLLGAETKRPFLMGFTPLPPVASAAGIRQVYEFITRHADIIAHHFDGGVPWDAAYNGEDFSRNLQEDWRTRNAGTPAGLTRYVAVTPLNILRNGLAPLWGERDNMPLPEPWVKASLDDPRVKKAYLSYCLRVVQELKPDYLAIGIEVNMLIDNAPDLWPRYLALHEFVYRALKEKYPALPVFATLQYDWLRGVGAGPRNSPSRQMAEVRKLARMCDIMALSTYQFGPRHNPLSMDFFKQALSFGKPVAVAESGALSRNLVIGGATLPATEYDQEDFVSYLLWAAAQYKFVFVINFVPIDYDRLYAQLAPSLPDPKMKDLWSMWISTGLADAKGRAKSALPDWDAWLALPVTR